MTKVRKGACLSLPGEARLRIEGGPLVLMDGIPPPAPVRADTPCSASDSPAASGQASPSAKRLSPWRWGAFAPSPFRGLRRGPGNPEYAFEDLPERPKPPPKVRVPEPHLGYSSFYVLAPTNRLRLAARSIVLRRWFDPVVNGCIVANSVSLALRDPMADSCRYSSDDTTHAVLIALDYTFTSIFALELLLKLAVRGAALHKGAYLRDPWNWLDFLVVVFSVLGLMPSLCALFSGLSALRALRLLRTLRSIEQLAQMKATVQALLNAGPKLIHVGTLAFFVFLVFGILGVQLFTGELRKRCHVLSTAGTLVLADAEWPCGSTGTNQCARFASAALLASRNSTDSMSAPTLHTVPKGTLPPSCASAVGLGALPPGSLFCCEPVAPAEGAATWFNSAAAVRSGNPDFGFTNFDAVPWSFLLIYRAIAIEDWQVSMEAISAGFGAVYGSAYMLLLTVLVGFLTTNMALAVIYEQVAPRDPPRAAALCAPRPCAPRDPAQHAWPATRPLTTHRYGGTHPGFDTFGGAMLLMLTMATSEGWASVMRACMVAPPFCGRQAGTMEDDSDCGMLGGFPAIAFVVVYQVLGALLMMNLMVGVIVDRFSVTSLMQNMRVPETAMFEFQEEWLRHAPDGSPYISCHYLPGIIARLPRPLGQSDWPATHAKPTMIQVLRQAWLPLREGQVQFHEVLFALARAEVGQRLPPCELKRKLDLQARRTVDLRQYREHVVVWNAHEYYAAETVQRTFRGFRTREVLFAAAQTRIRRQRVSQAFRVSSTLFTGSLEGDVASCASVMLDATSQLLTSPSALDVEVERERREAEAEEADREHAARFVQRKARFLLAKLYGRPPPPSGLLALLRAEAPELWEGVAERAAAGAGVGLG